MFKVSMTGFDELQKSLREMQRKAESLERTKLVPMAELLNPRFLQRYTRCSSFEQMLEQSGFKVETTEDFKAIPDDEWDVYVRSISTFPDWNEMQQKALEEWTTKKLGL